MCICSKYIYSASCVYDVSLDQSLPCCRRARRRRRRNAVMRLTCRHGYIRPNRRHCLASYNPTSDTWPPRKNHRMPAPVCSTVFFVLALTASSSRVISRCDVLTLIFCFFERDISILVKARYIPIPIPRLTRWINWHKGGVNSLLSIFVSWDDALEIVIIYTPMKEILCLHEMRRDVVW